MKIKALLLIISPLILLGCSDKSPIEKNTGSSNPSANQTIVTSFYPLAFMTKQIVGDEFDVINLAGASDVHDYELTPQDRISLETASLLVYQGAQLEPWTKDVVPSLNIATLEVTHDLNLTENKLPEDHESEENSDEEDHDDEEHEEHDHGQFDPHTWLDPVLAQTMVDEISQAIAQINPDNKALFSDNANQLKLKFNTLDVAFKTALRNCENDAVIVSHDAYGYLAERYNFETQAIAGLSTQDEPSAKLLAELKTEAQTGMTHLLVEENNVRRYADTLVRETNLEVLPVNPLGQGTLNPNQDFFDAMQQNLNSFKIALNCNA